MRAVERWQRGVRLARLFYAIVAVIALVVAVGVVAPAVVDGGGCQVVVRLGGQPTLGPASGNPAPQGSPGPGVPGLPSGCVEYLDLAPALVAIVLGVVLLLTAARLAREPERWGLPVTLGVVAGIVASLLAADAVLGIATSDQPQQPPGLGIILVAFVPVIAALGSAFVVWREFARKVNAPSD